MLGQLGIHKFYLGYPLQGVILLTVTIFSAATVAIGIGILGIIIIYPIVWIEGILYLKKTDEEFHHTYVENKKAWF